MSSRGATCWRRAAPSDAGSIFWRRSCSARPTRCSPSRTTSSGPTSASTAITWYGTPREPAVAALAGGRDVLCDIDWQGTQQLREKARSDLASIFVLPPSIEELEKRLRSRAQDPEDVIGRRMTQATEEMSHWAEYDYVGVNADIERPFADVRAILAPERLKRERQPGLSTFVRELQGKL